MTEPLPKTIIVSHEMFAAGVAALSRNGCKADPHIANDVFSAMWNAQEKPSRMAAAARDLKVAAAALPSIGGSSPEQTEALRSFVVAAVKDGLVRGEL